MHRALIVRPMCKPVHPIKQSAGIGQGAVTVQPSPGDVTQAVGVLLNKGANMLQDKDQLSADSWNWSTHKYNTNNINLEQWDLKGDIHPKW